MIEFSYRAGSQASTTEVDHMRFSVTLAIIFLSTPGYANQTVRATWYGHELAGNRTASGERPFGTCLRVSNPKTGRSVSVRVNDRGPFTKGVSLDLSYGAARAIGMRVTQNVTVKNC
jgi:rare lipoprotein A (peptidoglycan hydrolase)